MSKARDLANLGSNTAALATDAEVTSAVAPKADTTTVTAHTGASTGVHGATGAVVGTTDTQTLTNKTVDKAILISPEERFTVSATAATGTVNFDVVTQGVLYFTTNASGNFTLNFRGNSGTTLNSILAVGDAVTCSFLVTNGGTAYYATAVQVDGASQTVKWSGGTAPASGNASSIDAYQFTVVKTAATPTYTVFGAGPVKYA